MRNYRLENKAELHRINSAKRGDLFSSSLPADPVKQKRWIIIRAVLCVLALAAAVIAFSTFAKQCTNIETGWQTISPNTDSEALLYYSGISLNYDLEGTSSERRVQMLELRDAYSKALAHIYKLLDPANNYNGYVNIAYINAHPDTDIKVSPELYSVLSSALELTRQGRANIFGGALYGEWMSICVLNDSEEYDPLADQDERVRIDTIAQNTKDLGNFTLELKDGDTVRFSVSEEYRALLNSMECEHPVLDLGYLREAYELEYAAAEVEKAGFKSGFITTVSGMTLCLSEAEGGYIVAYAPKGEAVADVFKVPMTGGLMCCTFRSYSYGTDDLEYYSVTDAQGEHLRHPHYVLETGEVNDALLTVMVSASEGSFAEVCAESYSMICSRSAEDAESALSLLAQGMHAAFVAKAAPDTVVSDSAFESLDLSDGMRQITK